MSEIPSDLPREATDFLAAHPDTSALDVLYADLCGIVRGKRYPMSLFGKIMSDGLATPGSVFLLDATGESHDPLGKGFTDGDPDHQLTVIPGSLKPVPWADRPTAQVLASFSNFDGSPYPFEPRNVLKRVVERLASRGLTPVVAFELEFYLIDRERRDGNLPQPPLSPIDGKRMSATQVYSMAGVDAFGELIEDIVKASSAQGIATGAITKEYAPGQFEINLEHIDDPMLAADQAVMFKRATKYVAQHHGLEATFMAKPYGDSAGSGLHLHCSLLDGAGSNVFAESAEGPARHETSDNLRHAIGGVLDIMPESMAILAPNVNSFRRYRPNIFVPVTRCWAHENRSVALRIPSGSRNARRIESRIAGADANPYLTLASLLAGIDHGLENKIEPGPASEGNAGENVDPDLPLRPRRALKRLAKSRVLADYFGADYIAVYVACKEAELDRFEAIVSPAEYDWYLQAD